ncbi:hypothetical protein GXM_09533 [Nostoc sphaeroides CCNUC1]|uniref:Uncharacterized protein n=1 Tax=Nostoc sphaeroides CCNUC1 TaxID=2653204 RepID=A0A5P8WJM4_9NOSO|nr:hypothetical protein GXM_08882 [Nostoc sphaeroides CCNUC1]QFS52039.1 hypothetical protein GXM_09533 [Nostoc sphaeroides CCNUC1]
MGYAYTIYQKMIDKSLKQRVFIDGHNHLFVQYVNLKI